MAKQQSLAEIASGKSVDVVVDDFGGMSVVTTNTVGPYVVFAQPKATEQWTSLVQKVPGVRDGDQVLVYPEPEQPVPLRPMRFTMVACKQYWVKKDASGNMLEKPKEEQQSRVKDANGNKWAEEVFAACIVYAPRGGEVDAVPATCTFKTVKCQAAITMKQQIEAASKPEWADQGPAHKAAFAAFSKPFLRVVGAVSTSERKGASNFTYVQARAVVAPATPAEYVAVKRLMEEGDGLKKLKDLAEQYHSRLNMLFAK